MSIKTAFPPMCSECGEPIDRALRPFSPLCSDKCRSKRYYRLNRDKMLDRVKAYQRAH